MSSNQCGCIRKYFTNYANVGSQLNVIRTTGNPADGFQMIFPRPFQLLNITDFQDIITGQSPVFSGALVLHPRIDINVAYSELLPALMLQMMFTNRDLIYSEGASLYDGKYGQYFEQYLANPESGDIRDNNNFYSFMYPPSYVTDFINQFGGPGFIPLENFYKLAFDIMNTSDKRLFMAPGKYSFAPPTVPAGTETQLTQCFDDFQSFTDLAKFFLNYANPINIALSEATTYLKVYIESSDDGAGGGPVVWGSTDDKYTGVIQPDYSMMVGGDPTFMIIDFCNRLLQYITGDPGEPYANFVGNTLNTWAQFEVNPDGPSLGCSIDTPGGFSVRSAVNKNYNYGKLGFATPKFYELKVNFFNKSGDSQVFAQLQNLYSDLGDVPPNFSVLELKSVE